MGRRARWNLVLALLVAVLVALWWWQSAGPTPTPPHRLTDLQPHQVRQLRLERPGEPALVMERVDGVWQLTQPLRYPANAARIDNLLEILQLPYQGRFARAEVDLAALGLAPPLASLEVDGRRIDFGHTEPLNQRRYVRQGDQVYLIDDHLFYTVAAQVDRFISLKLLDGQQTLQSIHLPGLTLEQHQGHWQVTPAAVGQQTDEVVRLVQAWQYASAMAVTRATPAEGRGHEVIELGFAADRPPLRYALLSRSPELVLLRLDNGLRYSLPATQALQLLQLATAATPPP